MNSEGGVWGKIARFFGKSETSAPKAKERLEKATGKDRLEIADKTLHEKGEFLQDQEKQEQEIVQPQNQAA